MPAIGLRLMLGAFAGAALSLSAPAATVAHAHAHEHLLAHVAESHTARGTESGRPEVHAPEQHPDHAHATIDPGIGARCVSNALSIAAPPPCLTWSRVVTAREPVAPPPNESPPDPHDATPTRSRAPPVPLTI